MLNVKLYLVIDDLNNKASLWCVYPNGVRQCVHSWSVLFKD